MKLDRIPKDPKIDFIVCVPSGALAVLVAISAEV